MVIPVGCAVFTKQDPTTSFAVKDYHYERLVEALNHAEIGWIELDSTFGDGKTMIRIEDIVALELYTQARCDEHAAHQALNGE